MQIGTIVTAVICIPMALYIGRQIYLSHKYFGNRSNNGRLTCQLCGQQYDLYSYGWYNGASWYEPMKRITSPFCGCYKQVRMDERANKHLQEAKDQHLAKN